MTITPKWLLKALETRDGRRSAWTGREDVPDLVPQHRAGGMGGGSRKQRLSNVVWLESLTNSLIESDPHWQAEAKRLGIKISGFANPEEIPIRHAVHGWCLLKDDPPYFDPLSAAEVAEWEALQRTVK